MDMKKTPLTNVLELSVSERILLVEDIWDSIAAVPEAVPLTDAQKEELDRRLDAYHKNPAAGSPWDEVVQRIKARA
jgi:putative addiction module component (TIGR02574 family)